MLSDSTQTLLFFLINSLFFDKLVPNISVIFLTSLHLLTFVRLPLFALLTQFRSLGFARCCSVQKIPSRISLVLSQKWNSLGKIIEFEFIHKSCWIKQKKHNRVQEKIFNTSCFSSRWIFDESCECVIGGFSHKCICPTETVYYQRENPIGGGHKLHSLGIIVWLSRKNRKLMISLFGTFPLSQDSRMIFIN